MKIFMMCVLMPGLKALLAGPEGPAYVAVLAGPEGPA
jgi:hypothetical protein